MTWSVQRAGTVAVLSFVRPPENLLSFVLLDELDTLLVDLSDDPSVRVIVLTGGVPGYFVGHADLDDVGRLVDDSPGPGSPDAWWVTLERISQITQPVVAAVNGQACGGGTQRLPRLIGPSRAARMILSGDVVSAAAGVAIGLVDAVLPDKDFLAHAAAAAGTDLAATEAHAGGGRTGPRRRQSPAPGRRIGL